MKKIAFLTTGIVAVLALAVSVILLATKEEKHVEVSSDSVVMVDSDPVSIGINVDAGIDNRSTDKREEEVSEKADFVYRTHVVSLAALVPEEETAEDIRTAEELASYVLDHGLDGSEREAYLGDRYDEVQEWIDSNYAAPTYVVDDITYVVDETTYVYPEGDTLNPEDGINYYYGTLETYYNLDMSGVVEWMHSLGYSGEYWVRSDGVKMLGDYIMVAADYSWMPKGSILETSLGLAMVCDTGEGGWYWTDIATDW